MLHLSSDDEQKEDEIEGGDAKHFLESVNSDEQEKEDSQEELLIDKYDESCSGVLNLHLVNNSNSSCGYRKTDSEKLHKVVFKPIIESILKNKNVLHHAGNIIGKKDCSSLLAPDQHNTCKSGHNKFHSIVCNYCRKVGHVSHSCYIRRNSNVRNKYVWVPKGQVRSNTNIQGPKYKWVPTCPPSSPFVQINSMWHGHNGTEKRRQKPRAPHGPRKRLSKSASVKRREHIARIKRINQRKQWTRAKRLCSTSRMNYQKERTMLAPKARSSKFEHLRKMEWVCKSGPPST